MTDKSGNILIVDDDARSLKLVKDLLEMNGYTVFTAAGGTEALSMLKTERVRLVIIDHQMPDMSGIEVTKHIRKQLRSRFMTVFLLSASTVYENMTHAKEAGCDDFLEKPIDIKVLLEKVGRVMGRDGDRKTEDGGP